jgi:hypothetical protein
MLYHEEQKKVSQLYAMQILKKVSKYEYEVISRNYFTIKNKFNVIAKNINDIETIKIKEAIDIKNGYKFNVINVPMSKLLIKINKDLNLLPGDILRIA